MSLHPNQILLAPVVTEKSYELIDQHKYSFRVHPDAHKTQVRQAVEERSLRRGHEPSPPSPRRGRSSGPGRRP